jgi:hypothetical protein
LDPAPHIWGWPWHGLITQAGARGTLPLPSGRVIDCPVFGGNWTYLWDIGMPAVDYTPEDPDEQWLTKGIIRGDRNFYPMRIYGGQDVGSGPIKLGDHVGVLGVQFNWSDGVMSFTVSTNVNLGAGPIYVEKYLTMTAAAAGFPDTVSGGFTPVAVPVDRKPDGTGMIVRVSRARASSLSYAEETVALIEITVTGEFATMNASLTLLAGGTDTRGVVTVTTEPPPEPAGVVTIGSSSAKVGTWITDSQMDATIWAWYLPDGSVDLIQYQVKIYAVQTNTLGGDASSQSGSLNLQLAQTRTLTSSTGVATTVVNSSEVVNGSVNSDGVISFSSDISMDVDGFEVMALASTFTSSGALNFNSYWEALETDVEPINQALRWLYPGAIPTTQAYIGRQSLMSFSALSNKVLDCPVQYFDFPDRFDSTRLVVDSEALTPSGRHAGLYTYHTSEAGLPGRGSGSYNPITGQVLRNQNTELFTWV